MGWDEGDPSERPPHEVWVDTFSIATRPVTNAEYAAYLAATHASRPRFWGDPDFSDERQPVVGLSWDEALAYATWAGARMPWTQLGWSPAGIAAQRVHGRRRHTTRGSRPPGGGRAGPAAHPGPGQPREAAPEALNRAD